MPLNPTHQPKTPRDVPNVGSGVSIVWLRKTFKNCVSFIVSKKRSQKWINRFVPEQPSPPAIVNVPLDWYHYDYRGYTTHWPTNVGRLVKTHSSALYGYWMSSRKPAKWNGWMRRIVRETRESMLSSRRRWWWWWWWGMVWSWS